MRAGNQLATSALKGAVAGAAATWLMTRATTTLYEREDPVARRREDAARGGRASYEVAAEKAARAAGVALSDARRASWGRGIHWTLGVGMGALYGVLRTRLRHADWAQGLGFGLVFWIALDELVTPAAGLTPGPAAFPWQTHARGAVGHAVYGLAADTVLDALDRVA